MGNDGGGFLFWTKPTVKTAEEGEAKQLAWTSDGGCADTTGGG